MIAASPNVPSDTELSCLTPFRDLGEQRIRQQRRLTILSFRGRRRRIWSPAGRLFRCGYLEASAHRNPGLVRTTRRRTVVARVLGGTCSWAGLRQAQAERVWEEEQAHRIGGIFRVADGSEQRMLVAHVRGES